MGTSVDLDNSNGGAGAGGGATGSTPFIQTLTSPDTNVVHGLNTTNIVGIVVWDSSNEQTPLTQYTIIDDNTINIPSAGNITNARIEIITRTP